MVNQRDLEMNGKFVLSFPWNNMYMYAKEHMEVCQTGFPLISGKHYYYYFLFPFLVCQAIRSKLTNKQLTILISVRCQM